MNKLITIILVLFSLNMGAGAKDLQTMIGEGNQLYLDAQYELAIETYLSIIDSGYASAELYYNLGNAYYKSHNITMALVNFERASILKPKDKDIIHNLEVAREFVVDRIDVLPEFFIKRAWVAFVKTFDADIWSLVSLLAFFLALALFLAYFFSKRLELRKITFWNAVFIMLISISTLLFAFQQNKFITRHNQAIIVTPSVSIKSSPDENSGTDLFLLHEGTKVTVADELGNWREVVLSDGNRGWLKESNLIMLNEEVKEVIVIQQDPITAIPSNAPADHR